jgi:hypothetical protein
VDQDHCFPPRMVKQSGDCASFEASAFLTGMEIDTSAIRHFIARCSSGSLTVSYVVCPWFDSKTRNQFIRWEYSGGPLVRL